jgi:microcystin-dependent protein
MAQPFIGQVKMFGGNFAPIGYAFCNGQLLAIAQNDALFALIGTTYGGDGQTTFALPDLRGRIPLHQGQGAGLSNRVIGEMGGSETVTLTTSQLPSHTHAAIGQSASGNQSSPAGGVWAASSLNEYSNAAANTSMNANAVGANSGGQPHDNVMPFLCVNFIIALVGIFPSRN